MPKANKPVRMRPLEVLMPKGLRVIISPKGAPRRPCSVCGKDVQLAAEFFDGREPVMPDGVLVEGGQEPWVWHLACMKEDATDAGNAR